jgi:hypothetical protein
MLNLLIGLIINNFWKIKEELGGYMHLNIKQRQWIEMQRIMQRKDPMVIL